MYRTVQATPFNLDIVSEYFEIYEMCDWVCVPSRIYYYQ